MKKRGLKPENILSTAWQITWNNKILWVFGFFAAWLSANISFSSNTGATFSLTPLTLIAAIFIALISWSVGALARISLINEIAALDVRNPKPIQPIKDTVRLSYKSLINVLLMQALIFSPTIILSLISYAFLQPVLTNPNLSINMSNFSAFIGSFLFLALIMALITIPIIFIDAFAYRGIVLDKLGVKDSVRTAIQLLKKNLKRIFVLASICSIGGGMFSSVVTGMLLPILFFLMQSISQCASLSGNAQVTANCMQQWSTNPAIFVMLAFASLIGAALLSVWVTFQSATFTLAYRKFTESKAV